MRVGYEWDIETVDATTEDVLDHSHQGRLHDFGGEQLTLALNFDGEEPGTITRLVLVRTEDGGDRLWAYVTQDGKLPEYFSDSLDRVVDVRVPKRFHAEFNR